MIIIHIAPGLPRVIIIVSCTPFVRTLHQFLCLFMVQAVSSHDSANPVFLISPDENIEDIRPSFQDVRRAAPQYDTGLLRKLSDRLRLALILVPAELFLNVGLIINGNASLSDSSFAMMLAPVPYLRLMVITSFISKSLLFLYPA